MSNTIETITEIIDRLSVSQTSQFIGLTYTSVSGRVKPETSRMVINTNVNLERVYKEDLQKAQDLLPTLTDPIEVQACNEIIASLQKSLDKGIGNNPEFTRKNNVERVNGTLREVNRKDGTEAVEICGIVRSKKILIEGEFKKVNSRPKTIAKNKIKKLLDLGTSKIRTLTIDLSKIAGIRHNGDTIELCDELFVTKVNGTNTVKQPVNKITVNA
jgi:hypothetical protein